MEQAGLDFEALSQEFWTNDGLADASYEQLEKAGIPRNLVDSYIEGQQALLSTTTNQVYDSVGGQDSYEAMTDWAGDNLSEGQIDAFNRAVNSGDMEETMFAVQGLRSMYEAQRGVEPARNLAGQSRPSADAYSSLAQMKADGRINHGMIGSIAKYEEELPYEGEYHTGEFWNDLTGKELNSEGVRKARQEEIAEFKEIKKRKKNKNYKFIMKIYKNNIITLKI